MNLHAAAAQAALERHKALCNEERSIASNTSLSDAAKREALTRINTEIEAAEAEARTAVERGEREAQVRALSAQASGIVQRSGGALGEWLQNELRALSGASGAGAAWTPAEASKTWFDRLALDSVILRSGVSVYRTDADSVQFPRLLTDVAPAATAEAANIGLTDPSGDLLTATPRKFATITKISREAVDDSDPKILDMLARSMIRAIANKIDVDSFEGSGTAPSIRGLKNVAGIGAISMGTNGAALTNLDPIAQAVGMVAEAGGEASAIVIPARTWKGLLALKEATGSNKPLLSESAASPTGAIDRRLFGVPVYLSGTLATTETQGTSNVASSIYVYDASQITAVIRQDAKITLDNSAYFEADQVGVKVTARYDLVVPSPAAVVRIAGVL